MAIQATSWQAQYTDNKKVAGGDPTGISYVNVSAVDMAQLKIFSIIHNTYTHTYNVPRKKWYGLPTGQTYVYPTQYILQDGSTLTVDNDPVLDQLVFTQVP